MKLAVISDIQCTNEIKNTKEFCKIIKNKVDAVLFAGDTSTDFKIILKILDNIGVPIFYILGNDDMEFFVDNPINNNYKNCINVDCKAIKLGKYILVGNGFFSGVQSSSLKTFKQILNKYKSKKIILLSHCPPYGILDLATMHGRCHIGDRYIRKFIDQYNIKLCFCGHVHREGCSIQNSGRCVVVNVAGLGNDISFRTNGSAYCIADLKKSTPKIYFSYVDTKSYKDSTEYYEKYEPSLKDSKFLKKYKSYLISNKNNLW